MTTETPNTWTARPTRHHRADPTDSAAATIAALESRVEELLSEKHTMLRRLNAVGSAAKVGIWEYDFRTNELWLSDEIAAIYGLDTSTLTWGEFASRIHPDDMDPKLQRPTPSFPFGQLNQFLVRVRHADGNYRTIRSRSTTVGHDGVPYKKLGAHIDVTDDEALVRNEELAEANERLRRFSYLASHDLKSPLRGINQLIDMIDEDHGDELPPSVAAMMNQIGDRSDRMSHLVADLLHYSTSDLRDITVEKCDINRLIHDIERVVDTRGHRLAISCEIESDVVIAASPLTVCVQNLIDNACKHHDRDSGNVTVDGSHTGDVLTIAVGDDGPGISPDVQRRMFEPFFTTRADDGTGIGLAHVEQTAKKHGATLIYDTSDRGTTFELRWPTAQPLN